MRTHTIINTITGETFIEPMPYSIEELKAVIADMRWQREVGGCEIFPGVVFPTDRDARANLGLELVRAEKVGDSYGKVFVIRGTRVPVNLESLRYVDAAVEKHVSEAFKWESDIIERIEAGESPDKIAEEIGI